MPDNRLKQVLNLGQSIWYDNIQRGMIARGEFQKMIAEDGLRGVTSNPTIFDKAISKSPDYDADIMKGVEKGLSAEEIYWDLVIKDIQSAADIFKGVHAETRAVDGYISIEVSPLLARDTQGTVRQALELFKKVDRKNVMIKIPATKEGIPAIKAVIAAGIPVNVTLIFSVERYKEVMNAYLEGLEELHWNKKNCSGVASVASFFISRVDTLVDKQLEEKIKATSDPAQKAALTALLGKAAIANSRAAYAEFKKLFAPNAARFFPLRSNGAQVQRPLWASTSTKNPAYRDTLYVEELIGAQTVNTLPPATVDAFRDHGVAAAKIETGDWAEELTALAKAGIDLKSVTQQLENEGVDSFCDSFRQLLAHLEEKRGKLAASR